MPVRLDPPVRLRLSLTGPVAEALTRLAIREDRTFERQAVRLLVEGLRRAGTLDAGRIDPTPDQTAGDQA